MNPPKKRAKPKAAKVEKRAAPNKRYMRDVPGVPTAKQIEQSISQGTTVPLTEFVKGVKL